MGTFSGSEVGSIHKTTDSGASWNLVYNDGAGGIVFDVAINPLNTSVIYATSYDRNVVKSTDAGATWVTNYGGFAPDGRIWSIVPDPLYDEILWAGVGDNMGVYQSANGGSTWTAVNDGLWNKTVVPLKVYLISSLRHFYNGTTGSGAYKWGEPLTATPTRTPTRTSSPTPTMTRTGTRTLSPTASLTRTATLTGTKTVTRTATRTATRTPSVTPTGSLPPSRTPTQSPTLTATQPAIETVEPSATPTTTPAPSSTQSPTPSSTPAATAAIPVTGVAGLGMIVLGLSLMLLVNRTALSVKNR